MYGMLKLIHVSCVAMSITGFVLRSLLALGSSQRLGRRWLRVLPHVIDTVLLASALGMVILSAQYPFVVAWLTAKVLGLVVYIALGAVVMRNRRPRIRLGAFVMAMLVVAWIVSVALTRHPAGVFSLLG